MTQRPPAILTPITACLEPLYRFGVALRNKGFDCGLKSAHSAGRPVISVGNLTAGGTGKTPTVCCIAKMLQHAGHRPAVLLRGYGSTDGKSDEQQLLSRALSGVPVIANPDRVASARLIDRKHPQVDVLILDDGFQHRRLRRDLDLVLLDATDPFGGGHLLPRGLLREPIGSLRRADAVVVTRCDRVDPPKREKIDRHVESVTGRRPIAHTRHHWDHLIDQDNRPGRPDGPVLAVCGIGNPQAFFAQAQQQLEVAATRALPDHHVYHPTDLQKLSDEAEQLGATSLLVTEKDWVKLEPLVQSNRPKTGLWRPVLSLEFLDGRDEVNRTVCETAGRNNPREATD